MTKGARAVLAVVPALALWGCVMPDQMAQLQSDVAKVQQELAAVSKTQGELSQKVTDLQAKVGSGDTVKRSEIADLTSHVNDIVRQNAATADKVDQVNTRVDRLSQDVQAARESARRAVPPPADPVPGATTAPGAVPVPVPVPPPGGAAAGAMTNPNSLYTSAYADFSKGNYPLAIQGFEEYAEKFPEADLADNAMYWIGECYFSQGNYKEAIGAFDKMLAKYPGSDKAAAANLKKALAFVQSNQIGQGVEQLRYVVATYPGSDEARIAKDRLATLGK
ncbi:MAG TPA: tol-pal system protein YbgF [Candidatus Polarisedimenticolaceae bacterium]|nr:tol-pal system protein YbgF [Candidatus Polarisedimenticolaceae bacterium]